MDLGERLDPRGSSLSTVLVFLGGLLVHAIDQMLHFRAGPIPVLVTAPAVAVLRFLYLRPDTRTRWLVALLCWGAVGSGLAILGVYLVASSYRLPRPMTGPELVLYDLGMFLWFVLSLTGAYAFVARRIDRNRYTMAIAVSGPFLQFGWILFVVVLAEVGRYV